MFYYIFIFIYLVIKNTHSHISIMINSGHICSGSNPFISHIFYKTKWQKAQ